MNSAFFVSIPHSGEKIAPECPWLQNLNEAVLFRDSDRFVDQLYQPAITAMNLESVYSPWHRYVIDLNRLPEHIEDEAVEAGGPPLARFHKKGLHWVQTSFGESLLAKPLARELHLTLLTKYYWPFHQQVAAIHARRMAEYGVSRQLDLHSMPSVATKMHSDNGKRRPQVVISDFLGKASDQEFVERVLSAFTKEFLEVNYNDPYIGGGITEKYGQPTKGQSCVQIELRRDMYMDEDSKQLLPAEAAQLSEKLHRCLLEIASTYL